MPGYSISAAHPTEALTSTIEALARLVGSFNLRADAKNSRTGTKKPGCAAGLFRAGDYRHHPGRSGLSLTRLVIRNGHFGLARSCPVAILTLFPGGGEMAFRAICVALLLSSLPSVGCGTVGNLARQGPEQEGGMSPFGGVRQDVSCIQKAANGDCGCSKSDQNRQVARRLFCAADLPFSLIGDVVTWPYTVTYSYINQPFPIPPVRQAPIPPVTQATAPPVTPSTAEGRPQNSP